jgi:ribosome-binding factor A
MRLPWGAWGALLIAIGPAQLSGFLVPSPSSARPQPLQPWGQATRSCTGSGRIRHNPVLMAGRGNDRGKGRGDQDREKRTREPSKRQLRVGRLLQSTLSTVIRQGFPIKTSDWLDDHLRAKISVVDVICAPDLRNARVEVSIFGETVEKREVFVWLVNNAKAIRHALSQQLKDYRSVPELHFRQTDLGAGSDMFALLEKLGEERMAMEGGVDMEEWEGQEGEEGEGDEDAEDDDEVDWEEDIEEGYQDVNEFVDDDDEENDDDVEWDEEGEDEAVVEGFPEFDAMTSQEIEEALSRLEGLQVRGSARWHHLQAGVSDGSFRAGNSARDAQEDLAGDRGLQEAVQGGPTM